MKEWDFVAPSCIAFLNFPPWPMYPSYVVDNTNPKSWKNGLHKVYIQAEECGKRFPLIQKKTL